MPVAIRAATRIQDMDDANVTLGVGVDEYALVYDHDTARFVLRAPFAGLLATGATTGATAQAQAFTNGVVSPFLAPAADSTTAWQVRKADKTTAVVTVDTAGGSVGIGKTPDADASLDIYDSRADGPIIRIKRGANSPTFLEFNRSSGAALAGGSVGILGGAEVNLSYNMDYSDETHRYYNNAFGALWLALNQDGAYLQYAPGGYVGGGDIWTNQGSLYNWIVDKLGNETLRGNLTAQGVGLSTITGYLKVLGNSAAAESELYGGLHLRSQLTVRTSYDTIAPLIIMRSYGTARPSYFEHYLGGSSTWQHGAAGSGDNYSHFLCWGSFSAANAKVAVKSTGEMGIGTVAPSQKLDVAGNIALSTGGYIYGDTTTPFLSLNSGVGTKLGYGTSYSYTGNLQAGIVINNVECVRFSSAGNVGINTTAPATALHVVGAATITGGIRPAADSTTALQLQNVAGTSVLNVDTTNGYVGIGTTAPGWNLEVVGTNAGNSGINSKNTNSGGAAYIRAENDQGDDIAFRAFGSAAAGTIFGLAKADMATMLSYGLANFTIGSYDAKDLVLGTDNAARVTIKSTGLVGIGDSAPAEVLDVAGNINTTGVVKVDDVQVLSNRVIDARAADVANSGDATTDGLIDALRDAMVAHGLIAASA